MAKLLIPPDSEGYSFKYGPRALSVQLDGGPSKFRQDFIGLPTIIDVEWKLKPANFDYIMAFYRTATANGSLSFTIDLILEGKDVTEYTAHFVPDTFSLKQQEGDLYLVTASLEVVGAPPSTATDNATITAGPQ